MLVAVLNSRQSSRPRGNDDWIIKSHEAVKSIEASGDHLITSVGMSSWEITLFLASKYRVPLRLIMPNYSDKTKQQTLDYFINQFQLDPSKVEPVFIDSADDREGVRRFMKARDKHIAEIANRLYFVSIRPDGHFDKLSNSKYGHKIDHKYRVEYCTNTNSICYQVEKAFMDNKSNLLLNNYLIHWTRSSNSYWPGETAYQYYESIIKSAQSYSHGALATVQNILRTGKIFGSERHMRKGNRVVSFSDLPPCEALNLMKYRARYREMSFEPYGIAIDKEYAESIGIKRVIYGESCEYEKLAGDKKPFFQSQGKIGNWSPEQEFRHLGDLSIRAIPSEHIRVIVLYKEEIELIQNFTDYKIVSLYNKKRR